MAEYRPDYAIDIERVISSKGGRVPGFVVGWVKRFFHVDLLNDFFVKGYEGVEFCTEALKALGITLEIEGLENVPQDGSRYTFVSNHPLGGIDGVALGSVVGENFGGRVRYLVNDLLMNIKGLAPICVPINKFGGQARELPRLINEAFESENHMIVFPAGLCSRRIDGKIQDLPWGKAFVSKSIATGRKVVPVHFIAENSKRFYRIAKWNKLLGIKFNIAMMFLPDEMVRARGSVFRVVFGKPVPPEAFDDTHSAYEWAQWVRETVYKL